MLQIEKIFEVLGCTDEQKVSVATYKFGGEAEHRWRMIRRQYKGKESELVWSTFKTIFHDK
ncbi:hypothetical protein, partial [Enterococcus faecalis]|uniref:hypothetical protein n=1 Tax=Enterococcus faecalis TaxID=1351 RepID=UPI003D6B1DF5